MSKNRIVLVAAVLILTGVAAAAAAVALAGRGGETSSPRPAGKPHVDVEALGSAVGVPTDPVERAVFLRKAVLTLAAADAINVPRAQRALREIEATGTLGRSLHPVAMKVRALNVLPPQAHLPAEVARFVGYVGELTHSKPADAGSARLLRSSLGAGGGDVYGVASSAGSPCFILTGYGGTCAGGNSARTGVAWIIGGAHDGLPGVFVALAADDVTSVRLDVDGASAPVSLRSNVAFAELPARADDAIVTTTRAGGRTSSESLALTR